MDMQFLTLCVLASGGALMIFMLYRAKREEERDAAEKWNSGCSRAREIFRVRRRRWWRWRWRFGRIGDGVGSAVTVVTVKSARKSAKFAPRNLWY